MWISSLDFDGRTGTAFELFPSLLAGLTTGLGLGNDIRSDYWLRKGPNLCFLSETGKKFLSFLFFDGTDSVNPTIGTYSIQ